MSKRSRVTAFLWEQFPYWLAVPILLAVGIVDVLGHSFVEAGVDGGLFAVFAFLGARSVLRVHRSGTTAVRRELLAALPRIADGRVWLARDDHKVLMCLRAYSVSRLDEDEMAALAEPG